MPDREPTADLAIGAAYHLFKAPHGVRYFGSLASSDQENLVLESVMIFGTEGRSNTVSIPASATIYPSVSFKRAEIMRIERHAVEPEPVGIVYPDEVAHDPPEIDANAPRNRRHQDDGRKRQSSRYFCMLFFSARSTAHPFVRSGKRGSRRGGKRTTPKVPEWDQ